MAAPVLAGLPPPQRQALQVVMLQSGPGEAVDERTVGTALWSVLAALAQSGPVLIALDDLPYLDAASAGALRFALRRLGRPSRVRLVATARGDRARWAPLDGLPVDRVLSARSRPGHRGRVVRAARRPAGGPAGPAGPAARARDVRR